MDRTGKNSSGNVSRTFLSYEQDQCLLKDLLDVERDKVNFV